MSSYKSRQVGLAPSISFIVQALRQLLMPFYRKMASSIVA
jgi:hypothetical protein